MSGVRIIALLVMGYLAFLVVFPRFEATLLDRIARSEAIRQSDAVAGWFDGMTTCECSQGRITCSAGCSLDRRLDGSSTRTVATSFFASTFVLTPFISRYLVFIRTYGAHRTNASVFGAVAAMAMFGACLINFVLGACLGRVAVRRRGAQRWAQWFDRWGPGVFVLGCFAPVGFPIGLASLYLGWRRTRVGIFLLVAALGCACHVLILIAASGPLLLWWGA